MESLLLCSANYVPLSPVSFLEQAADVHGSKVSVVYGSVRFTWTETYQRCIKLASALVQLGISPGDIVAALAPNVPALYELHFAVPMAGAVLSALNVRLDAAMLALILETLEAKLIFVDYQFVELVSKALDILFFKTSKPPVVVLIQECDKTTDAMALVPKSSDLEYNGLLAMGRADFEIVRPNQECDPISVNYTSGSTGNPKGVVYSHRAAYLNSMAAIFRYDLGQTPVFLWTVDMFRCNGWCLTWAMAALGGINICLRNVTAKTIFSSILVHKATHLCGAPTLLKTLADAPPSYLTRPLPCKVKMIIAGVLPMPNVLAMIEELGFTVFAAYGMTEALGPVIVSPWRQKCDCEHKRSKECQGLQRLSMIEVDVKDPTTMKSIPRDGKTTGEIMLRGNTLMSGYYKNPKATEEALNKGWFRTGDVGVRDPDGNIQLKDRAKDVIISGGQTVSTIEVEAVLLSHPKVLEAAVVGKPDEQLKATPCAFVKLKEGYGASTEEMVEFCGNRLPHFMVPQTIVFADLPINFTGKVHKFILREKACGL